MRGRLLDRGNADDVIAATNSKSPRPRRWAAWGRSTATQLLSGACQHDSGRIRLLFRLFLIETAMRVAGATLLVIGFLLCVSVAWAAIGFFAMGSGLIFLLIVEERKRKSALHLENAAIQPALILPSQLIAGPVSTARGEVRRDERPCETDKWRSLVESDQELSQVVTILMPFGQKYVDQLAGAYVAFNNKAFLPTILNLVTASARQDASLTAAGEMNSHNSIAIPNDQGPNPLSEFAALSTNDKFSTVSEIDQSLQQRLASGQTSEDHAAGGGVTTEALPPAQTPAHESNSDEFENLKKLLEKIKDREDPNVR